MTMSEKDLEGMEIVAVDVDAEHRFIRLTEKSGRHVWLSAIDDCCSKTWFEHVDMVTIPFTIRAASLSTWQVKPDVTGDDDVTKRYALHMKTSNGHIDVVLRNDSNGYYGGEVEIDVMPRVQYGDEVDEPKVSPIGAGF